MLTINSMVVGEALDRVARTPPTKEWIKFIRPVHVTYSKRRTYLL